jgi:hypothetical protein
MIPNKLIQAAVAAALFAAATGQLPKFIQTVRVAQYQLLKDSQASKWGRAMILPIRK